jgi:hypothetical protein
MTASRWGPAARIFGIPAVLGTLTAAGLLLALIEDGLWDLAGSLALAIPLAVVGWKITKARRDRQRRAVCPSE